MSLKHLVRQTIALNVLRVGGAIISLLVNVLLARTFESDLIGQYFIALGTLVFLAQIATFGCTKSLIKSIPSSKGEEERKQHLSVAVAITFIGGVASYFIYRSFFETLANVHVSVIEILILSAYFLSLSVCQARFQAIFALSVQFIVQPSVFVVLVMADKGTMIDCYLASTAACLSIVVGFLIFRGELKFTQITTKIFGNIVVGLAPYFLMFSVGLAVTHLMLPLCSLWLTEAEIALLGIIVRLVNVMFFAVTSMRILLLPRLSKAYVAQKEETIRKECMLGAVIPASIILLVAILIGPIGLNILALFGHEYSFHHELLFYAILLLIPAACFGWAESLLLATNRARQASYASVLSAVLVFSIVPVVAKYGMLAAITLLVGVKSLYAVATILIVWFGRRGYMGMGN